MTSPIRQSPRMSPAPQTPPPRPFSPSERPPPLNRHNRPVIESFTSSTLLHPVDSVQRSSINSFGGFTDNLDFRVIGHQGRIIARAFSLQLRDQDSHLPLIPSPATINSSVISLPRASKQAHFHHAKTTGCFSAYEANLNELLEETCPISGLTIEEMLCANRDQCCRHEIVAVTNGSGATAIYDYRSLLEWGKQGSMDHRLNGLILDPLTRTHLIDVSERGFNAKQVAEMQSEGDIIRPKAIHTNSATLNSMKQTER